MSLNTYQELLNQCDIFSSEMKKSILLKDNNHLVVDIEKFKNHISNITAKGNILSHDSSKPIDFSWRTKLEELLSSNNENITTSIFNAANYILESVDLIIKYLALKERFIRTQHGNALVSGEDFINLIVELKIQGLSAASEKIQISNQKIIDSLLEIKKIRDDIENKEKQIELNLSDKITTIGVENISKLSEIKTNLDDRINKLTDEKIKRADEIYKQTLSLNSTVAGKIISNDFSKSARREKRSADFLRFSCFGILIVCAFLIYSKGESFTLTSPGIISTPDYINLIKSFAASAFLISLSILCLKESSKHRVQQYFYENQSLKILALGPLISDIEKEKQESVKQEVAKFLFSMEQKVSISDDSSSAFLGMTKILEKLIDKK